MMVWLNGEWKEEGEAAVAADDAGFLRGEGVFETMLALHGRVFSLKSHWERFEASCQKLALPLITCAEARAIAEELLVRNAIPLATRTRVRVTRSPDTLLFTARESTGFPRTLIVHSTPYRRNERGALSGMKAISYGENAVALREARQAGADEVLFYNTRDHWCEGGWSNVFAVERGVLLTPPLSSGCLPGVTRAHILELAQGAGIAVREEIRMRSELAELDEFFVTSSLIGVGIVARLDDRVFAPGPVATRLSQLLHEREQANEEH